MKNAQTFFKKFENKEYMNPNLNLVILKTLDFQVKKNIYMKQKS